MSQGGDALPARRRAAHGMDSVSASAVRLAEARLQLRDACLGGEARDALLVVAEKRLARLRQSLRICGGSALMKTMV